MAEQQRIMWTAIPHGLVQGGNGTQLRLSVYISPRLYGDNPTTLADFPDFQHWASIVAGMSLTVTFALGGTTQMVNPVGDPNSPSPDEDVWNGLFSASTPVYPYAFPQYHQHYVQSYPARNVENFIKGAYGRFTTAGHAGKFKKDDPIPGTGLLPPTPAAALAALNPTDPSFQQYGANVRIGHVQGGIEYPDVGALDFPEEALDQMASNIIYYGNKGYFQTAPVHQLDTSLTPSLSAIELQYRFLQHRIFHRWNAPDATKPRAPQTEPDFHNAVAAMAAYPQLMRKLGLVVDLLVPAAGLDAFKNNPNMTITVHPSWSSASAVAGPGFYPRTAATYTNTDFTATPQPTGAPPEIQSGMLNLTGITNYGLSQIDIDGAANGLVHYVNTAGNVNFLSSPTSPSTLAMPRIRTGGIQVVRHGHAFDVTMRFDRNKSTNDALEGGQPITFYAEDIFRGFRPDIFDVAANKWLSLMARDGTYSLPDVAVPAKQSFTLSDEGYMSQSAARNNTDTSPNPDLYIHEKQFRWNGWSLGAPRPGKVTDDAGNVKTIQDSPGQNINMKVSFKVTPGSMPRLRFGRQYRVRMRAVDLAGNSPPVSSTLDAYALPDPHAAAPANAPFTYRRFESVPSPTVVPHDDFSQPNDPGESMDRLVIRSDTNASKATFIADYIRQLARYGYPGFHAISQRHIAPPRTTAELAERHAMLDTGPNGTMNPNAYGMLLDHDGSFGTDATLGILGAYPVDQLTLPYLPDVLARGVSFVGLPGSTAKSPAAGIPGVDKYTFGGTWPDIKPFRIQVIGLLDSDTQKPPAFNAAKNILTVYVKQADAFDVQMSSFINNGDLNLLGMWQWALDYLKATGWSPPAIMTANAVAGLLWWLTPSHTISFVHAVQRPLIQPKFATLIASKAATGQTYAVLLNKTGTNAAGRPLYGPVPISGKSTAKVDLLAEWTEPIDDGVEADGFHRVAGHAHALDVQLATTDTGIPFSGTLRRHQFPDTKYRRVTYTMVATSRFRDYFPFTDEEIASGKTPITLPSPPVTVDVPNSAPPDAPKVLYVMPAFKWDPDAHTGNTSTSARHGGYVRIYMDRPWFSSGDGELLGVVTAWNASQSGALRDRVKDVMIRPLQQLPPGYVDPSMQPYVTLWGRDPLRKSPALTFAPTFRSFPLADPAHGGLTATRQFILENGRFPVSISGHAVQFDTVRQLWYSDVQMTWGDSYYPFVQLALVRFQPNSITGAAVSRLLQADFVQLAPDRTATVTSNIDPTDRRKVGVTLVGPAPANVGSGLVNNQVVVMVESQQPNVSGDLGWMPVPNGAFDMSAKPLSGGATQYTWNATVLLPRPIGSQPYRLVFKEYEWYIIYDDSGGTEQIRRVVYADTVDL